MNYEYKAMLKRTISMEEKRFTVFSEWDYREDYDRCIISPATSEDYDGENFVGSGGACGMSIDNYTGLKEAILNAGFNPFYIQFEDLTEEETRFKDEFLKNIEWDSNKGIIVKEK